MNLGENIYKLRTGKNMSQGDLADALDVSRQSVSKWENNSATPELDKLIRMSQLFGVSLDELAGLVQEPKPTPADAEPNAKVIYIEKPVFPKISIHKQIGGVLLLVSLIYGLLLNGSVMGSMEAFLLAAPVAICGILFLFMKLPQFYCGWICAGAYWMYLFILFHNTWEQQYLLLFLGVALVIAMIIWSVRVNRSGKIRIPLWLWIFGGLLLAAGFVLLWLNTVPPFLFSSEHPSYPQSAAQSCIN